MQEKLKLINMHEVQAEEINWLWYPYIPYGKITVIQRDPGDGKTTVVLAVAAAMTSGLLLPEAKKIITPSNVIFQTAEDGLGDTVKPRLVQAGADCSRVLVIDESEQELTLSDERIEQAITLTDAKLFVLDPLQAYVGANVDMHRANEIRPVLKKLSMVAEKTGCAVVIVGHLNKGMNKSQYRGLGSIDIQAAARSVLTVGRIKGKHSRKGNPTLRRRDRLSLLNSTRPRVSVGRGRTLSPLTSCLVAFCRSAIPPMTAPLLFFKGNWQTANSLPPLYMKKPPRWTYRCGRSKRQRRRWIYIHLSGKINGFGGSHIKGKGEGCNSPQIEDCTLASALLPKGGRRRTVRFIGGYARR